MTARPILLILCGPPFAGKSTLARALEQRFAVVRIEVDEVHRTRGLEAVSEDDWQIALMRSFRRLHRELAANRSVVWDSASLTRAQRDRIRATGRDHGAAVHLIYVATSDAERGRRRIENLSTQNRVDVPEPGFEAAGNDFEIPGADEAPIRFDETMDLSNWIETQIAPLVLAARMEQ